MTNNPELKTWFDDALKQGHTIDELIPHLKEHGYTDEMIDPVVSQLKAELNQTSTIQETNIDNQQASDSEGPNHDSNSLDFNNSQQTDTVELNDQNKISEDNSEEDSIIQESEDVTDSLDYNQDLDNDFNSPESLETDQDEEEQEEANFNNQNEEELSLKEIEAELETEYAKNKNTKSQNLVKPLITSIILISVLIGAYFVYPSVVSLINN